MNLATVVNLTQGILALGAIYALVNVGFVLLFRTTGVINFAQGQLMLLGAYAMWPAISVIGYWPALLAAVVVMAGIGAGIYGVLMRFQLGAPEFTKVIITLMLAIVIEQVPAVIWGPELRILPSPIETVWPVGGGHVPAFTGVILALAVVVIAAVFYVTNRTVMGIRMRAVAQNENLAAFAGMRVHHLGAIAWALAAATATVAGVMYAQRASLSLELPQGGLGAFPAAVIGGMDSIGGTLIGAFLVAAIQVVAAYYLGSITGDVASYAVMLVVLLVAPRGLFGSRLSKRL
jgi:branched-chain amino acid transport system permease protein